MKIIVYRVFTYNCIKGKDVILEIGASVTSVSSSPVRLDARGNDFIGGGIGDLPTLRITVRHMVQSNWLHVRTDEYHRP